MKTNEIRRLYLDFFKEKKHVVIPSASLVPENDPTTLFTGSGMQSLLPYLLGKEHPQGKRLVDSQKCFRAEDIEEVGDNRHTTFFEMLGNWSLGEYFKEDQLSWCFEFLIEKISLDPNRCYVTVFAGDKSNNIPRDIESASIWKQLFISKGIVAKDIYIGSEKNGGDRGMKEGERIFYYDAKKNWWSRTGVPENMPAGEPGGPDSEIFYEFDIPHDKSFGKHCHPNCDCGRFMEIGNSVFMQYIKNKNDSFAEMKQRNVDFGGGLERITAAANNDGDVFRVDSLWNIIKKIEELTSKEYADNKFAFRVIADHIRGAVFMIGDGVYPSNTEQGYFIRRLLRRAILQLHKLKPDITIGSFVNVIAEEYKKQYPNIGDQEIKINKIISEEEARFSITLDLGLKQFNKFSNSDITGRNAFILFSTYGFPFELTRELAQEKGIKVDEEGFKKEMLKHQETSRLGAKQKFKGGLADHEEMSIKYHTATHLLHQALKDVLGDTVEQRGSNITDLRLRFDFSHEKKLTMEEKQKVENIVNEKISDNLKVTCEEMSLEKARSLGAIGLFGEKYDDIVKVYKIGNYSIECCGGPHVENTKILGHFKIKKEEASSAGVRRIKAILE